MRTLLIESSPNAAEQLAGTLGAAGHDVVRCHHADGPAFPCAGLTDDGCPLEGHGPVDVAITVHTGDPEVTARESGATCAVRTGIPLVVVAPDGDHGFTEWAETCASADEVSGAVDRAVAAAAERRAAPLLVEAQRVLALEEVDAGTVRVDVTRDGDTARIVVWTEHPLDERVANMVATRVHAADGKGSWPTSKVGVAVGSLS